MLLGSLAFVTAGIWIAGGFGEAPEPGREWVGWLSILFFGACGLVIGGRLFDDDVQIRISGSGIYSRQWSEQTIPWGAVTEVSVWRFKRNKFLILHLVRPEHYPPTTFSAKMAKANRTLTGGDIAIDLTGMDCSFDEASVAIEYYRTASQRPVVSGEQSYRGFGRREL